MKSIVGIFVIVSMLFVFIVPEKAEAGTVDGMLIGAAVGATIGVVIYFVGKLAKPDKNDNSVKESTEDAEGSQLPSGDMNLPVKPLSDTLAN